MALTCLAFCLYESAHSLPAHKASASRIASLRSCPAHPGSSLHVEAVGRSHSWSTQSNQIMRLRGGRERPIDMEIVKWWDSAPSAKLLKLFFVFLGVYMLPAIPRPGKIDEQIEMQGRFGVYIMLAGLYMVLKGPQWEERWGPSSLGFTPISSTVRERERCIHRH